jgi:cytochrome c-type biogenesis protein CcmH/NrfG
MDTDFHANLASRTDKRILLQRVAKLERRLRKERREHRKEQQSLVYFASGVALVVILLVCLLAAPLWTVVLPLAGLWAICRKAGW